MLRTITLLLFAFPLLAADFAEVEDRHYKAWKRSVYVLAASQVADAASSWNQPELNPVLAGRDGRFAWRGAAIKGGAVAGSIALQAYIVRKRPRAAKWLSRVNFATSGVTFSVAVYNFGRR